MADKCYFYQNEGRWGIQDVGWSPCGTPSAGNAVPCCAQDDMCLENLMCYNPNTTAHAGGSTGYYIAGCTDLTYTSPYCNQNCITWYATDVVENTVDPTLWNCCGTVNQTYLQPVDCSNPTNETFNAPSAAELISKGNVTYPLASNTTGVAASAPASAPASTQTIISKSGSSLSAGAAAGIGIAVAVAIVAFAALAWFCLRKRSDRRRVHDVKNQSIPATAYQDQGEQYEMGNDKKVATNELSSNDNDNRVELAGDNVRRSGSNVKAVQRYANP